MILCGQKRRRLVGHRCVHQALMHVADLAADWRCGALLWRGGDQRARDAADDRRTRRAARREIRQWHRRDRHGRRRWTRHQLLVPCFCVFGAKVSQWQLTLLRRRGGQEVLAARVQTHLGDDGDIAGAGASVGASIARVADTANASSFGNGSIGGRMFLRSMAAWLRL